MGDRALLMSPPADGVMGEGRTAFFLKSIYCLQSFEHQVVLTTPGHEVIYEVEQAVEELHVPEDLGGFF